LITLAHFGIKKRILLEGVLLDKKVDTLSRSGKISKKKTPRTKRGALSLGEGGTKNLFS